MNANTMSCSSSLLVLLLLVAGQHHLTKAWGPKAFPVDMVPCEKEVDLFRLPRLFRHLHYKLTLRLIPKRTIFTGYVVINMQFKAMNDRPKFLESRNTTDQGREHAIDRKQILLNADGLNVKGAIFHNLAEEPLDSICHDAKNQVLVIGLKEAPNCSRKGRLTLTFEGNVQTEAKGLFASHIGSNLAIASHLEPNYARRVFPCFDDPEFKATFKVAIEHPKGLMPLSNMSPCKFSISGPLVATTFEETPKMSTYLLSFAVGKFNAVTIPPQVGKIPITIYVPDACADPARSMLIKALRAYDKVSDYFMGTPQPVRKIDFVAVDMEPAAMENWGLVTMKWNLLCTPENLMKPEDQNEAVTALTNMLVRFWLGNLVTVCWWNDLWFVEGLANYVSSELATEEFPELSDEMYTLIDTTYSAMKDDDDIQKTHPIKGDARVTADKIRESYDSFASKKSEALFRMFAFYVGKEKFRLAVHNSIAKWYHEGLITIDDWWVQLAEIAAPLPYISQLKEWTEQAGYPIISVYLTEEGQLSIGQRSNFWDGKLWPIPITYEVRDPNGNCLYRDMFFLRGSLALDIDFPFPFNPKEHGHLLKVNPNYEGYYRVEYECSTVTDVLVRAVRRQQMKAVDRFQILNDYYYHTKQVKSEVQFSHLLKIYSDETNHGVMLLLTRIFTDMCHNKWRLGYSDQVKSILKKYYELTGRVERAAGSNVLEQCARGSVLYYLVAFLEYKDAIQDVQEYKVENGRFPLFLEHIDGYLRATH